MSDRDTEVQALALLSGEAHVVEQRVIEDDFGACPHCGANDGYYSAGKAHWFVCHEHRVRWFVGSNLFSSWREEGESEQRYAYEVEPAWGLYRAA